MREFDRKGENFNVFFQLSEFCCGVFVLVFVSPSFSVYRGNYSTVAPISSQLDSHSIRQSIEEQAVSPR